MVPAEPVPAGETVEAAPDATVVPPPSGHPPSRRTPADRTERRPAPRSHGRSPRHPDPAAHGENPQPAPSTTGILARRDPVPGGVQAQLRYFQGGAGPCRSAAEFAITAADSRGHAFMSAPDVNTICVSAVRPGIRLDVTLTSPSGRTVRSWSVVPADEYPVAFSLRRLPHDELGNHIVRAAQGGRSAATSVEVRNVRSPHLVPYVDDRHGQPGRFPSTSPAGTTFRVAVGGFRPHSVVHLRIYGSEGEGTPGYEAKYLTSHPVRVDALGFGIWKLHTSAADPAGCYLVTHESIANHLPNGVNFCLSPSPGVSRSRR
jgi:hypothetical protein